jgi:putative SOS response-associated peptidase YedK
MLDDSPFAFAGLWKRWKEPASGKTVKSFTIITCPPNALCGTIHNRMPVILEPFDYSRWLGETPAGAEELLALLKPFPAERMQAHEIGPRIGNVKNDDAELISRIAF